MLVPLWLDIKGKFNVPVAVYMDDVLILCRDAAECARIYKYLHNLLYCVYDLDLNVQKTETGRFSTGKLSYIGWHFAGGAMVIDAPKVNTQEQLLLLISTISEKLNQMIMLQKKQVFALERLFNL